MDFLEKILDLPVLVQGALGSLLFWVSYEATKLIANTLFRFLGKFSGRIRRELQISEAFHHAHSIFEFGSGEKLSAHLVSLHMAINRLIHALIYACIGAISSYFVEQLALVAYLIAIGYLFLGLKAAHVDFGMPTPKEAHKKEFERLVQEMGLSDTTNESTPTDNPNKKT